MGATGTFTLEQAADWERDGYVVLPGAVEVERCRELVARAEAIVDAFDPATVSIFTTHDQTRTTDRYFLESASRISCFFEEEAFAPDGSLRGPKAASINKIGHALHDLDPTFDAFSRQPAIARAAASVGFTRPLLVQSMYIFKGPHIGGEVACHQDATFLSTEPSTVVGFWVALQDATIENGCLWAQPGGHRGPLRQRFVQDAAAGARFVELDASPLPEPGGPELVPLEATAGTLVVLHGNLPHWSDANRSERSRHAYAVHVVDGAAHYPVDNWLQRDPALPLRGFTSADTLGP